MPDHDVTTLPQDWNTLLPVLRLRARRLTDSPEDAADLTQETALRLWALHQTGNVIESPRALAMTILRNLARSHWRGRKQFDPLEDDMLTTRPDAPRIIACAELDAAIDRLPGPQAELLHYVEGGETSPARLANLTGHPVGTVMSRLARARANLRQEMGLSRTCSVTSLYEEPDQPW